MSSTSVAQPDKGVRVLFSRVTEVSALEKLRFKILIVCFFMGHVRHIQIYPYNQT